MFSISYSASRKSFSPPPHISLLSCRLQTHCAIIHCKDEYKSLKAGHACWLWWKESSGQMKPLFTPKLSLLGAHAWKGKVPLSLLLLFSLRQFNLSLHRALEQWKWMHAIGTIKEVVQGNESMLQILLPSFYLQCDAGTLKQWKWMNVIFACGCKWEPTE